MTAATVRLRRTLRRLGAPGIAGIGLMLACAAMYVSAQRPLEARVAAERAVLESRGAQLSRGGPAPTPEAGLEAFYRYFATGVDAEQQLERLFALARRQQLELLQGSYGYNRVPGERLARYEISLPVKGTYAQVRRFLASALNEIPVVALDRVAFERKRAVDPHVEANIRLTLFVEPPRPVAEPR